MFFTLDKNYKPVLNLMMKEGGKRELFAHDFDCLALRFARSEEAKESGNSFQQFFDSILSILGGKCITSSDRVLKDVICIKKKFSWEKNKKAFFAVQILLHNSFSPKLQGEKKVWQSCHAKQMKCRHGSSSVALFFQVTLECDYRQIFHHGPS